MAPLSADIHLLGDLLGQVIREQHGQAAFDLEEAVRHAAIGRREGRSSAQRELVEAIESAGLEQKRILIKSFSNYFQLINIAEEQQRIRVLREREIEGEVSDSVATAVSKLARETWSGSDILQLLDKISIDLVLTAHPTEAKRQDFLLKLRDISDSIDERDRVDLVPREQERVRHGILAGIEEMWQTSVTRAERPSVLDEVEFGLHFVTSVIMQTVVGLHREVLRHLGPLLEEERHELPNFLRFSSWIGGDRDGNPFVTAEVTRETVRRMRRAAKNVYRQRALELRDRLTQTLDEARPSSELLEWLSTRAIDQDNQFPQQPYRQMMASIASRLESESDIGEEELMADLRMVEASLLQHAGFHAARDELWELIQMVRIFGLHLMPLDLREDARRMMDAVHEILRVYDLHPDYQGLREDERRRLLARLLASNELPNVRKEDLSEDSKRILSGLVAAGELMDQFGEQTFRSFIGSMSHHASDVLAMQWLARVAGVGGRVDVVPLFETPTDLERAGEEVDYLLSVAPYREQLAQRGDCQQIMLGYSDSAKEGGYLAAHWALYRAQERLSEVVRRHGVCLELFHGRGGSIGRGGGPTNRAIQAQPKSAMKAGLIRMTEQGEVIAYRYSRPEIADRHLQQVVHATMLATGEPQMDPPEEPWCRLMDRLAERGRRAFRALVYENERFVDYWSQITPFHELEELPIGSRPAKRKEGGFEAVRAIPWVFSWMQCRALLPSWYGIGSAISEAIEEDARAKMTLQTMYERWAFFRLLIENVELDLAKVELEITKHYGELVGDDELRAEFHALIWREYERTRDSLLIITGREHLLDSIPVIQHSIERRNPYVDPLNFIQVSLLKELRGPPEQSARREAVLAAVLATVNGVAAGMKNTG